MPWADSPAPPEHAIRGFAGTTLSPNGYELTAQLLTATMGFERVGDEGSRFRFWVGGEDGDAMVDVQSQPEGGPGRMGIGVVHPIAWRAVSPDAQVQWRHILAARGLDVTPVLDRHYFRSIYYREPGGVLFEIATDPPGFTVDEEPDELGTRLALPPWLESRRDIIQARLPEVRVPVL